MLMRKACWFTSMDVPNKDSGYDGILPCKLIHHGKNSYVWTPELLSFHINAIHDQIPSPTNLKLWGKTNLGLCQLCHHRHCTLLHILNGFNHSLQDGRYSWRHDQTLRVIVSGLAPYIKKANTRKGPT